MLSLGNRVNQLAKVDKVTATPTLLVGEAGQAPKPGDDEEPDGRGFARGSAGRRTQLISRFTLP